MPRWISLAALLLLAPLLASCLSPAEHAGNAASAPLFDPLAFFEGASSGEGRLQIVFQDEATVTVSSNGVRSADGSLTLDQTINRTGKKQTRRQWVMREVAPGSYSGSLTEAEGPVELTTQGNRLTIRYITKSGERVEQFLYLSADGRSARNFMTFHKYGITAATMQEVITRAQ